MIAYSCGVGLEICVTTPIVFLEYKLKILIHNLLFVSAKSTCIHVLDLDFKGK